MCNFVNCNLLYVHTGPNYVKLGYFGDRVGWKWISYFMVSCQCHAPNGRQIYGDVWISYGFSNIGPTFEDEPVGPPQNVVDLIQSGQTQAGLILNLQTKPNGTHFTGHFQVLRSPHMTPGWVGMN